VVHVPGQRTTEGHAENIDKVQGKIIMNLILVRNVYTDISTIGDLLISHTVFCHTLEDATRRDGKKVPGNSAIPAGRYPISIEYSPKFKKMLPRLSGVPNYDGILMHGGNTAKDTSGCILTARNIIDDKTIQGNCVDEIIKMLSKHTEPCTIEIVNCYPYCGI